jgi:hypothetical protein
MDSNRNKDWMPLELKDAASDTLAHTLAHSFLGLIKMASIRYELGLMTKDEALAVSNFAYMPVRYGLEAETWQNSAKELLQPSRLWTYGDFYEALWKFYKNDYENSATSN